MDNHAFNFDLERMKKAVNDVNVTLPLFDNQQELDKWLNNEDLWEKRNTTVRLPDKINSAKEIDDFLKEKAKEIKSKREITLYHLNKIIENNVALDYEILNQCQNSKEIEQYCDEVCKNLK